MPLMLYEEYVTTYFSPGSRPLRATVNRWLREKKLPGRKIGNTVYIDTDLFEAKGNPLVARLISDVRRP